MTHEEWLQIYNEWRKSPERRMHELPAKPPGFDMWLQGQDPLKLSSKGCITCKGGRLVSLKWEPKIKSYD